MSRNRQAGFSLPELAIGLVLTSIVTLVAISVVWLLNGERRLARQDQAVEELSRQTRAVLRNPDQCAHLFQCNLNPINLSALGPVTMTKGLATYSSSPTCAPSNPIALAAGGTPVGESTLKIKRMQLTNPMLLAYNELASGTVATVSYRMEVEVGDTVTVGTAPAPGGAPAHRAITFSDVTLLVKPDGTIAGCGNAARSPASTFTTCSTSSYLSQVNGANHQVSCGADPTCPSTMFTNCAALAALKTGAPDPAIYFSGASPIGTVSATGEVCKPQTITGYYGSSDVLLAGTSLASMTSFGGTVSINADTVGSGQLYSGGGTSIVARTVADLTAMGNGGTCVSAQTMGTVVSPAGGDVSLYGRSDGPSTVMNVNMVGGNLYVKGLTFLTGLASISVAGVTLKDVILPSLGGMYQTLDIDGAKVNGTAQMANSSTSTIKNSTFAAGFNEGASGNLTMSDSTVNGTFQAGNSVTTNLNNVTINGPLKEAASAPMNITNSTINGAFSAGNWSTTNLNNVTITGSVSAAINSMTFVGVTIGGNFDRGNSSTYDFTGGSIGGNVSGNVGDTASFSGTYIAGNVGTGNAEKITFTNGASVQGTLDVTAYPLTIVVGPNAILTKVTGNYPNLGPPAITCTGNGRVIDRSGASANAVSPSCAH